jgi:hypothetical protein
MKCDAAGTLVYATYLGAQGGSAGGAIAMDAAGSAYVTGGTSSFYFPVVSPLQPSFSGGAGSRSADVFVAKFGSDPGVVAPVRVTLSRDAGQNLWASVILTNPFPFPVPSVSLTSVRGGTLDGSVFINGVPVPQHFGTINPGQSVAAMVTFPSTAFVPAGFTGLVQVNLSSGLGEFTDARVVRSP